MNQDKLRVHIVCEHCGEHYILRGKETGKDRYYGTGFKRCICENESGFSVYCEAVQNEKSH